MEIDALKFTVLFSSTFVYGDQLHRKYNLSLLNCPVKTQKANFVLKSLKKTTMTQKRYKKKTDPSSTNSRY